MLEDGYIKLMAKKSTTKPKYKPKNSKKLFKRKIDTRLSLFIIAFCLVGILTVGLSFARGNVSSVATFDKAQLQSTSWGKQIYGLESYNGKIYAGYGDWNANTGPIMIQSYNPTTGLVQDEFTLRSHAAHVIESYGNDLFLPSIDGQADMAILSSGQWREVMGINGDHWFDSLEYGGRIWLAGQRDNRATIASSTDRGATWKVEYQATDKVRFHFITEHNGKLYTQAGWDTKAYVYDPTASSAWTETTPITQSYGSKMASFAGKLVSQSYPASDQTYIMNYLNIFDGSQEIIASFGGNQLIFDFTITDNLLYVLDQSGGVYRTADLANWTKVASVAKSGGRTSLTIGRSIAVLGDSIYVGGDDSKLYKYPISTSSTTGGKGRSR